MTRKLKSQGTAIAPSRYYYKTISGPYRGASESFKEKFRALDKIGSEIALTHRGIPDTITLCHGLTRRFYGDTVVDHRGNNQEQYNWEHREALKSVVLWQIQQIPELKKDDAARKAFILDKREFGRSIWPLKGDR